MTENNRFTFEEHLKKYCMPTRIRDNENYRIVEEEEGGFLND